MKAIITGIGHYVPDRKLTNKDLEKMVDTNDEWITTRTGIKERRILEDGKGSSYMAVKAAQKLVSGGLAHTGSLKNVFTLGAIGLKQFKYHHHIFIRWKENQIIAFFLAY